MEYLQKNFHITTTYSCSLKKEQDEVLPKLYKEHNLDSPPQGCLTSGFQNTVPVITETLTPQIITGNKASHCHKPLTSTVQTGGSISEASRILSSERTRKQHDQTQLISSA